MRTLQMVSVFFPCLPGQTDFPLLGFAMNSMLGKPTFCSPNDLVTLPAGLRLGIWHCADAAKEQARNLPPTTWLSTVAHCWIGLA